MQECMISILRSKRVRGELHGCFRMTRLKNAADSVVRRFSSPKSRIDSVVRRFSSLKSRIDSVVRRFSSPKSRIDSVVRRFSSPKSQIDSVDRGFSSLKSRIDSVGRGFSSLKSRINRVVLPVIPYFSGTASRVATSRRHDFSTEAMPTASSGECGCVMSGPKEIMSMSG